MTKPQLLFRQLRNSYCVVVQNLEALSVTQIQELQKFVVNRHGYFDFDRFTFCIQKRITFTEFVKLLHFLELRADVQEEKVKSSDCSKQIGFGKYKGMLYSELPDSYLLWLKKNYNGDERETLMDELTKRSL